MHLQSAHIRHYKSLDDVTVEFATPITVIAGANAAGKSNLVDCLRFVRDAVVDNLELAVSKRGGIGWVRQHSSSKPFTLSVGLTFDEGDIGLPRRACYEFAVAPAKASNYEIESESACYDEGGATGRNKKSYFNRDSTGKVLGSDDEDLSGLFSIKGLTVPTDRLAIGTPAWFGRVGNPVAIAISGWHHAALYANTLRANAHSQADIDTRLSGNGQNWASVLRSLLEDEKGRLAVQRINDCMQAAVPGYKDVDVPDHDGFLVPTFRFEMGNQSAQFNAGQLSDGTLRIFGILLALYQLPAPGLLVIEEPEQTVHPGALAVLADAMREVSETTQIIVTTHSPHFIDHFQPEEIRVATMKDGVTRISPIKQSQVEAVKQGLMSLEEFMLAEGLQPEAE